MFGTYAAVLAVCAAALAIGQAAIALCGQRRWSWLSPAVGLALLCALCWGTVRLPGDGTISALLVLVLAVGAVLFLRGRIEGTGKALRAGAPVAALALVAGSLPFAAEGHFGILGTSLNPDMSQHLLAADRLAHGETSQLLRQGYPLGPHSVAVTLGKGLGLGLVPSFTGITIAVSVLAALTALAVFADFPPLRRTAGALLVGIPYMAASYFAQGDFKETMQALYVLAFALSLRQLNRDASSRALALRFVPAALLAVGSVYTYSFPGLAWLAATALIWVTAEFAQERFKTATAAKGVGVQGAAGTSTGSAASRFGPSPFRAAALALVVFAVLVAPEIGRMLDFRRFETFAPNGPGLGNLFGQISPFEGLGIWPSGDFRLTPGAGAVPALGYYLAAAFAAILLLYGLALCWRRRESAIVSGLLACALAYIAARIGGTPYTAAKAIEIGAPLAAVTILLPLMRRPVTVLYALAAGACSLLALANAPVGPVTYTPALAELRPLVASGSTVVLAPGGLLTEQHGIPYLAWELRGGRVCIKASSEAGMAPPAGVRFIISEGTPKRPPFPRLRVRRVAAPYVLWERSGSLHGHGSCPLIAVRQARQGAPP
ncbi:MAG: hypothetical protein WB507_11560 [Solirubrobacterales bacterium]